MTLAWTCNRNNKGRPIYTLWRGGPYERHVGSVIKIHCQQWYVDSLVRRVPREMRIVNTLKRAKATVEDLAA